VFCREWSKLGVEWRYLEVERRGDRSEVCFCQQCGGRKREERPTLCKKHNRKGKATPELRRGHPPNRCERPHT